MWHTCKKPGMHYIPSETVAFKKITSQISADSATSSKRKVCSYGATTNEAVRSDAPRTQRDDQGHMS